MSGNHDITSLSAVNGPDAITVDVVGIDAPCTSGKILSVFVRDHKDKDIYMARGACYAGTTWDAWLGHTPTGSIQDMQPVTCSTFEFEYQGGSTYHIEFPRSCIVEAPQRVRIYAEGQNFGGSAMGGTAGRTKTLIRSRR